MIDVLNIDAQSTKFANMLLDLALSWVSAHTTDLFVAFSTKHFED